MEYGLKTHLEAELGSEWKIRRFTHATGGCINETWVLHFSGQRQLFCKLNQSSELPMFQAEMEGLNEIQNTGTIRVPSPILCGAFGNRAYLLLEYLDLGGSAQAELGRGMAHLHQVQAPDGRFGWRINNTIGRTPQINTPTGSWIEFYREHRLEFQLRLAFDKGRRFQNAEALLDKLPEFFADYSPAPSLLHGDLWNGNAGATRAGQPVIFDPAVYYGDRETDIAFTEMFGGFDADFYEVYDSLLPLDAGYERRKTLYNLYHVLNHDHLFGGGYARQAVGMMDTLMRF